MGFRLTKPLQYAIFCTLTKEYLKTPGTLNAEYTPALCEAKLFDDLKDALALILLYGLNRYTHLITVCPDYSLERDDL